MTRINLPPGCYGLSLGPFKTKQVKPGGSVDVDNPRVLKMISKSSNTELGIISDRELVGISTKTGRVCSKDCTPNRIWQVWSKECPKCGAPTVLEGEAQ